MSVNFLDCGIEIVQEIVLKIFEIWLKTLAIGNIFNVCCTMLLDTDTILRIALLDWLTTNCIILNESEIFFVDKDFNEFFGAILAVHTKDLM